MKLFIAVILAIVACAIADPYVLDQRIIDRVNSDPKATWKAGINKIFEGKKFSEVKKMLGGFLPVPETDRTPRFSYGSSNDIPKEFDSYKNWPQCKHPVRNQARCGSCWAFSASEVLTDRFCIALSDSSFPVLSPQDMVSCDKSNYGCRGGYLDRTWRYLEQTGIVTDKCLPYSSGGGFTEACPNRCKSSVDQWKKYKAKSGSTKHFNGVSDAQQDILQHGPVQAGFSVYQDFFSYKSGVYHHVSGGLAGGHAIEITGWGVDSSSGQDYWIVKNSWSTTWGMNGYFWIRRGNNECGIDRQMYAAQADA